MQYLDQEARVVYTSKDGKAAKVFDALEWLAAMCSHIPNSGEKILQYQGFCDTIRAHSSNGNPHIKSIPSIKDL